jgi:hypothetical protein
MIKAKSMKWKKFLLISMLVVVLSLFALPGAVGAIDAIENDIEEEPCFTELDVSGDTVAGTYELSTPCGQPILGVWAGIPPTNMFVTISNGPFGGAGGTLFNVTGIGTDTINITVPGRTELIAIVYDCDCPKKGGGEAEPVETVWERDHEMECFQVWINEDNCFEFVFWWEYENNNWVKIYDMAGNEVFSIDMTHGKANFEACLPDGMYTVKTFHNGFEKPIQEFMIGKP